MSFLGYLWGIIRRSFHGAFRVAEIGEVVAALSVHGLGFFFPQWKETLEVLFLVDIGLFILTFFIGLLWAAYLSQKEEEGRHAREVISLQTKIPPPLHEETMASLEAEWRCHTVTEKAVIKRLAHIGMQDHTQLASYLKTMGLVFQAPDMPNICRHEERSTFVRLDSSGKYFVPNELRPYVFRLSQ
ncbi:MAG TPA: hypothetical protein VGJ05_02040 [Fimbriiglobus sp.]|jgi:hypothetical protein